MKFSAGSLALASLLATAPLAKATVANFDDVITVNGTGSVQQYANLFFNGFKAINCAFFFDPAPGMPASPNRKACVSEPNAASSWTNTSLIVPTSPSIATIWGLGINLTSVVFQPYLELNQTQNVTIKIKAVPMIGLASWYNYTYLANATAPVKFTPSIDDPTGNWTNLMRLSFSPTLGNGNGTNVTGLFIDDL
jgi:hypothetical protein